MTYSGTYKFDAMKKDFKDLTIEEFVRVICDVPKTHTIKIQTFDTETGEGLGDERNLITGDYWTLHRYFSVRSKGGEEYIKLASDRMIDDLEKSYFDYEVEYSTLDIYDYLGNKTENFDIERCQMLLWDMLFYKYHIAKELDERETNDERFFDYSKAVNILLSKIGVLNNKEPQQGKQPKTLPKELDTEEAKAVLQRAVGIILDDNYQLLPEATGGQAFAFALCAKEELKLEDHFKIFGDFWGIRYLKSKKLSDTSEEKIKKVKKIFPKHISHNALRNKM